MILKGIFIFRNLFRPVVVRCYGTQSFKMPFVAVRRVDGEERLQMNFTISLFEKPARTFNLDRPCEETVDATLQRISANVQKRFIKKKKKKGNDAAAEVEDIDVELISSAGEKVKNVFF